MEIHCGVRPLERGGGGYIRLVGIVKRSLRKSLGSSKLS